MRSPFPLLTALATMAVAPGLAACGGDEPAETTSQSTERAPASQATSLPRGAEHVELEPADFTLQIDNPFWPMAPGSRWVYRQRDGASVQRIVVTVTDRSRTLANGIEARVVRDVVSEDGAPVEITDDWYAQDGAGNVWYLGERTADYEDGRVVSRAGSFEAGRDGAEPGIAMPAEPRVGMAYRQEYLKGEAEDRARVLALGERVEVPFGRYDGVLKTADRNPLEPNVLEHKFYAPGVGPVLAVHLSGGGGREELISFQPGGG